MIGSFVGQVTSLTQAHPEYAMATVFAAAIIEALAVLGTVVPGTVIMMAVAGAAALSGQSMLPYLALAVAGAILGDSLSFWIGQRFASRLPGVWPFSNRPGLMRNAEQFFRRYGPFSVVLCRFVPVLRSTVPLAAGMAGMPRHRFLAANIASALVWAPAHIYPAQLAGVSLGRLNNSSALAIFGWAVVVLAGCGIAWAVHRAVIRHLR